MFGRKNKEESVSKPEIVVIGDSIRTLYQSRSSMLSAPPSAFTYPLKNSSYLDVLARARKYHNKYWTDPTAAFQFGGQDAVVTQVKGVIANDGKAYLLNVSNVITVEK